MLETLENRWVPSVTAPTLTISGAASVQQEATYTLHLAERGVPSSTIASWTINWGDSTTSTVNGNPRTATHVYGLANQTFAISATATDDASNSYLAPQNVQVQVTAPVVINFTSGTKTHLTGGAPDEYTGYTQNGFRVTPDVSDGTGGHFHLDDGALFTHVHDDEPGGPGVVDLQEQNGGSFLLDSLVVPRLDNTAGGGSLTFSDDKGDSLTVTSAGTYTLNWGPITTFTITPHNLLDSHNQEGFVDSIAVAPIGSTVHGSPAITTNTASPVTISGAGAVNQEANYTLHLSDGSAGKTVQSWTINWGDGTTSTVAGNASTATHVYASGNQTNTITAIATDTASNSYLARSSVTVHVAAPVDINFTTGTKTHLPGGASDEYINYTQDGFSVTPQVGVDGPGAHFHLTKGAMYTHVHDDEPGGPGVVTLQDQNGGSMFVVDSIVVPELDNTAGGGSLTFSDSKGDSLTVTAAGTYPLNWGPISSLSITPHNLLDSQGQRGYVDSITVASVS